MDQPVASPFHLGEWSVEPLLNRMTRGGETIRLEPRTMRLLQCLAARQGAVISADELLDEVWPGVIVTPDSIYQAVAALRRLLGDNPKDPRYIVTVPRQGYRMVAAVSMLVTTPTTLNSSAAPVIEALRGYEEQATPPSVTTATLAPASQARSPLATRNRRGRNAAAMAATALFGIAGVLGAWAWQHPSSMPPASATSVDMSSVAVLPIVDLTQSMGEEVFADGMTEELIDKLSQIPGLRVPSPTASFWFKDKRMTVSEIAAKLGVAYVLDGSVRKSDTTMRVAARLVRADDGFVIWSRSYDRPLDDRLTIQEDIAGEVRKALEAGFRRGIVRPGSVEKNG